MDQESPRYPIISLTHIRVCARAALPLALGFSLLVGSPAFGDEPLPPQIRDQMTKLGKDIADYEHQRDTLKKEIETNTDAKTGRPLTPREIRDKRKELETVEQKLKSAEENKNFLAEEARQVAEDAYKERKLQYTLPEIIRQLRANGDPVSRQAAEAYEAQLRRWNQKYGPIASVPPVAAPGAAALALDDNDCRKHVRLPHLVQSSGGQGPALAPAPGGQRMPERLKDERRAQPQPPAPAQSPSPPSTTRATPGGSTPSGPQGDEPLPKEAVNQIRELARDTADYELRRSRLLKEVTSGKDDETGRSLTPEEIAEKRKELDTVNQKIDAILEIFLFMNERAQILYMDAQADRRDEIRILEKLKDERKAQPQPPAPATEPIEEPIEDILKEVEEGEGGPRIPGIAQGPPGTSPPSTTSATPGGSMPSGPQPVNLVVTGQVTYVTKGRTKETSTATIKEPTRTRVAANFQRPNENAETFCRGALPPPWTLLDASLPSVVDTQPDGTYTAEVLIPQEDMDDILTEIKNNEERSIPRVRLDAALTDESGRTFFGNWDLKERELRKFAEEMKERERRRLAEETRVRELTFGGRGGESAERIRTHNVFHLSELHQVAYIPVDTRLPHIVTLKPDVDAEQVCEDLERAGFRCILWNPLDNILSIPLDDPSQETRIAAIVGSRATYIEPNDDRVASPAPSLNPLRWPRTPAAAIPRWTLHVPSFEE